jgi:hypothetical protein
MRSPEARAFRDGLQRRQVERELWIAAGMRQERREDVARCLRLLPTRRNAPGAGYRYRDRSADLKAVTGREIVLVETTAVFRYVSGLR